MEVFFKMAKITTKLPNPDGVSAGGTGTFRIPVGRRIHVLYMTYKYNESTQNPSHFTEIRIYINGQVFQRFKGIEKQTLNKFDGLSSGNGILEISFDRRKLKLSGGEEETSLNTAVKNESGQIINSMYMEVDIDKDATITPTDLSLYAKESDSIMYNLDGTKAGPGIIPFIYKEQRTAADITQAFQISDLINPGTNAPDKAALSRVTFIPSTGSINYLSIKKNNYITFERTDALNRDIQKSGVRIPQNGYFSIDTTEDGRGGDVIDLQNITDFRYLLEVSAPMTITILSEYMGVLAVTN